MARILFIDNQDSFSGIIADYLARLGQEVDWISHDQDPGDYSSENYSAMVLSPGPGQPQDSANLMGFIDRFSTQLPTLGICLGHQALAQHAGGIVGQAQKVVHGKVSIVRLQQAHPMWQGLTPTLNAVRYHSLAVLTSGAGFEPTAWADDGQIMAMAHYERPIWGLQWHPEALLSQSGLMLFSNWLTFADISCQPVALGPGPDKPPLQVGPLLPI